MKLQFSIVAFAAAALFALPTLSTGYSLIGGNLGIGTTGNGYQRDFRIFNNAADATANDNGTTSASYPGATGAKQAVWKAGEVWNSNKDGNANFDFDFQGSATAAGGLNGNTFSWGTSGCSGGTLAYTQTPISDGWNILMCENWTWNDGPTVSGGQIDIQGVAAHELGHALGLGHSAVSCSGSCVNVTTMCPTICGTGVEQRTLQADDKSGLAAIYGAKPANKPTITGLSGSFLVGGTLVITGTNFPSTVNVKFTAGTTTNTGTIPGVVYNVAATSTSVSVTIPSTAVDGNVLVWAPSISRLSNPYPIDIGSSGGGGGPCGTVANYGSGSSGTLSGTVANIGTNGTSPSSANTNFQLTLTGANANQTCLLLMSAGQATAPQLWGTLYVRFPYTSTNVGPTSATGTKSTVVPISAAMVGTTQFFQYLVFDPTKGYQHTGGLRVTYCP